MDYWQEQEHQRRVDAALLKRAYVADLLAGKMPAAMPTLPGEVHPVFQAIFELHGLVPKEGV